MELNTRLPKNPAGPDGAICFAVASSIEDRAWRSRGLDSTRRMLALGARPFDIFRRMLIFVRGDEHASRFATRSVVVSFLRASRSQEWGSVPRSSRWTRDERGASRRSRRARAIDGFFHARAFPGSRTAVPDDHEKKRDTGTLDSTSPPRKSACGFRGGHWRRRARRRARVRRRARRRVDARVRRCVSPAQAPARFECVGSRVRASEIETCASWLMSQQRFSSISIEDRTAVSDWPRVERKSDAVFMSRSRTPRNHNATHAMFSSCALVRARGRGARHPHRGWARAARRHRPRGCRRPCRRASPPPLAARTVAASARARRPLGRRATRARAPRAGRIPRGHQRRVRALRGGQAERRRRRRGRAHRGDRRRRRRGVGPDGRRERRGGTLVGVPSANPADTTTTACLFWTKGRATTEEGDEVCELPFPFAPGRPGDREDARGEDARRVRRGRRDRKRPPHRRAAALMRGVLPSDDAVIASTLEPGPHARRSRTSPTSDVSRNSRNLWWRALKLPMYSVAAAPLTTAAANATTGSGA